MPTTATITSFYTFSAGSKARATQVNNNFDVFRGHIIPIDPNTVASANVTYDLGSDPNRWRTAYVQSIDFDRSTSTASATIEADANTNTGEVVHSVQGNERFRLRTNGYSGVRSPKQITYDGSDPGIGGRVFSAGTSGSFTSLTGTSTLINGTTLTVTTIGNPVYLGLTTKLHSTSGGMGAFILSLDAGYGLSVGTMSIKCFIYRNTTTSIVATFYDEWQFSLGSPINNITRSVTLPQFIGIDDSAPAGTNIYFMKALASSLCSLSIDNYRLTAIEGAW